MYNFECYSGKPLEFALKSKMLSVDGWIVIGNEATLSLDGEGKGFQIECWVFKYIKNLKVKFRLFLRWKNSNKMNVRIIFYYIQEKYFLDTIYLWIVSAAKNSVKLKFAANIWIFYNFQIQKGLIFVETIRGNYSQKD